VKLSLLRGANVVEEVVEAKAVEMTQRVEQRTGDVRISHVLMPYLRLHVDVDVVGDAVEWPCQPELLLLLRRRTPARRAPTHQILVQIQTRIRTLMARQHSQRICLRQ
jgi:hypothetical protein